MKRSGRIKAVSHLKAHMAKIIGEAISHPWD